jgi:hypothetical protein
MLKWKKSPGEILDYAIDWDAPPSRLAGEPIVKSTWLVPNGLEKVKDSRAGNVCTIWLAGGNENARLSIVNRVETATGRVYEKTVTFVIGPK